MTEPTALFLASLSHRWAPIALSLPIVFGALTYASGVFAARSRSNHSARVRRAACAFRVLSFNLLAFSVLIFGISIAHVGCASVKAHDVACMSNLKALSLGALMYAQDYDDHFPPSSNWSEAIEDRVHEAATNDDFRILNLGADPFHCPASETSAGYGMNDALSARSEANIDSLKASVLFFDADSPLRSFAGGAEKLARERHDSEPNFAFADGHVKGLDSRGLKSAIWLVPSPTTAHLSLAR